MMKPFELNRTGLCTTCDKKISEEKIKSSNCDTFYHATCSHTDPICTNKAFLKNFVATSSNKLNFSWMCDHCLTLSESDKVATISEQISALRDAVVKLTDDKIISVDELKTQMSKDVQELKTQMNNEFIFLTESCTSSITSQMLDVKHHLQQGFETQKEQSNNNTWSDPLRTEKIKSALLVKPNGQGGKVDTQKVRKIVTDNRIPVNSVVESQNGELFVNLPDEESRDKVINLIEESGNEVVKLKSKLPTVSLMGMTVNEMKNEGGEDFSKTELEESIYNLNKPIADLVDDGAVLKVVYIKPPKHNQEFYTVVARVSPEIRKVIYKNRNKVHIHARVHNINDRFYIKRCNHCQQLGHYADKCQCDHHVCSFCARQHDSDECPAKNKPHKDHKCINCSESGFDAKGHPTFWSKCPTYKAAQDKLKKSMSFDYNNLN